MTGQPQALPHEASVLVLISTWALCFLSFSFICIVPFDPQKGPMELAQQ